MLELPIEQRLRIRLESVGFLVLKLKTPGRVACMDRMILRPVYWPGQPMFLELKRPGKGLRSNQEVLAGDWRRRGCEVLPPCNSIEKVDELCDRLLYESRYDRALWIPGAVGGTISYK